MVTKKKVVSEDQQDDDNNNNNINSSSGTPAPPADIDASQQQATPSKRNKKQSTPDVAPSTTASRPKRRTIVLRKQQPSPPSSSDSEQEQQDSDVSAAEEEEIEEEEEEDYSPEEDKKKKKRGRGRPPSSTPTKKKAAATAKTTKTTKTTTTTAKQTPKKQQQQQPTTPAKSPSKRKKNFNKHQGYSIIASLCKPKSNLTKIVEQWIKDWESDAEKSIFYLVNLIVEAGGGEASITHEEFSEKSFDDAAKDYNDAVEDSSTFPIGGKKAKGLHNLFIEFFRAIYAKCQTSIFFEHEAYLLNMVIPWTNKLGMFKVRGVRYASTLAAIQLANTLIKLWAQIKQDLTLTRQRLAKENKESESFEQYKKNEQLYQSKKKVVEQHLNTLIPLIKTRISDNYPETRSMCISSVTEWAKSMPIQTLSQFALVKHNDKPPTGKPILQDLGYALNDSSFEVRLTTINALNELYGNENAEMEEFTSKFKERVIEMATSDKNVEVCIQAINLVSTMYEKGVLEQEELDAVCQNYTVDNAQLSSATGALIYKTVLKKSEDKLTTNKKKDVRYPVREEELNAIIEFLSTKSKAPEIPYYLVSAMWGQAEKIFTDWPFFVNFLSDLDEKDISDKQLNCIAKIINASVKISCGANIKLFHTDKDQQKDDQEEEIEEDVYEKPKKDVTDNFLPIIPDLLGKYKTNYEFCENIIEMTQYFKLDKFEDMRQQTKYEELIVSLKDIYMLAPQQSLLETTAFSLQSLSNVPTQLKTIFRLEVQAIFNSLAQSVQKLEQDFGEQNPDRQELDSGERQSILYSLILQLERLFYIGRWIKIDGVDIHLVMLPLMEGVVGQPIRNNPESRERIIVLSTQILSQYIMWLMTEVSASINRENPLIDELNEDIVFIFYQFIHRMNNILNSDSISFNLRHFTFKTMIEVLILFNPNLRSTPLHLYSFHIPESSRLLELNLKILFKTLNTKIIDEISKRLSPSESNSRKSTTTPKKKNQKKKKTTTSEGEESEEVSEADNEESENSGNEEEPEESEPEEVKTLPIPFHITKDPCGLLDKEGEEQMLELIVSSIQAIQCGLLHSNNVGDIIKQVALSPGPESIATITEYLSVLRGRIKRMLLESELVFSCLKNFYLVCIENCNQEMDDEQPQQQDDSKKSKTPKKGKKTTKGSDEEDEIENESDEEEGTKKKTKPPKLTTKQYMFDRLKEFLGWLCTQFIRKNSLGSVFVKSMEYFFGTESNNHEDPENPEFLRVVSYIIPKLTPDEAQEILKKKKKKEFEYDEENPLFISLNNIFKMVELIADSDKNDKKKLKFQKRKKEQEEEEDSDSDEEMDGDQLIKNLVSIEPIAKLASPSPKKKQKPSTPSKKQQPKKKKKEQQEEEEEQEEEEQGNKKKKKKSKSSPDTEEHDGVEEEEQDVMEE
ncbi:STAG domain-containing protein [Cavenderia fasciculata]|uniref:STAG domain-containing protein n=1 Tax=Cavenderia fasciculata TaxID=261658 RepID=F4PQL0_CACFS|nr:STAG domain-containing protein [Cavenderia fasciculata]EGG21177.1 STAG domain-containing protein [Cavenderia fasciculata]|eukprot:XP_004359027.1 STAG domain-containing protein [Cavenderia fasciculata]